nr:ribonuclease Z [Cryptococcus depauperatus CBS 7855]
MAATKTKPLPSVSVQFLGTSSGGGPIQSRNCSCLAVDFGNELWLFDTADGSLGRLHQSSLKIVNITRIFITHLHIDHVLGLVPILNSVMSGVSLKEGDIEHLKELGVKKRSTFHIYGPAGLRNLVRTILNTTQANLSGVYAVHELLEEGQSPSASCSEDALHANEGVGVDMRTDADGVWKAILREGSGKGGKGWQVSAGPLRHRVPSIGYILKEPTPRLPLDTKTLIPLLQANAKDLMQRDPPVLHPLSLLSHLTSLPPPPPLTLPSGDVIQPPEPSGLPPRKFVIFGDCLGGTQNHVFKKMCEDASLLIHECTNAAIPQAIQRDNKGQNARMRNLKPSLAITCGTSTGGTVSSHQLEPEAERAATECNKQNGDYVYDVDENKKREVEKKAQSRGHSTPDQVGEFARDIRARRVVVNHFSAMFPAPRYHTSRALPSILSSICPFPYPTPHPLSNDNGLPVTHMPLTSQHANELYVRIIMQSIVDQIAVHCRIAEGKTGMVVASRDFMHLSIPSHELSPTEREDIDNHSSLANKVTEEWRTHGGIWIKDGAMGEWVGIRPQAKRVAWEFKEENKEWVAYPLQTD